MGPAGNVWPSAPCRSHGGLSFPEIKPVVSPQLFPPFLRQIRGPSTGSCPGNWRHGQRLTLPEKGPWGSKDVALTPGLAPVLDTWVCFPERDFSPSLKTPFWLSCPWLRLTSDRRWLRSLYKCWQPHLRFGCSLPPPSRANPKHPSNCP